MDCTGNPERAWPRCAARPPGVRVAFVGEGNTTTFDISQDMIRRQLTIHASWTFSSVGQAECARFIADRKVPLDQLLTHRFTLDQADEAYRLLRHADHRQGVFRVLIDARTTAPTVVPPPAPCCRCDYRVGRIFRNRLEVLRIRPSLPTPWLRTAATTASLTGVLTPCRRSLLRRR